MVQNLENEIWVDIPEYDGQYQISNFGRVKSMKRGKRSREKLLKINIEKVSGYPIVGLCKNNIARIKKIHRLIAIAFIPNYDNKPFINHKNGIKNDFRIDNLEWCTSSENAQHAFDVLGRISPYKGRNGHLAYNSRPVYCTTFDVLFQCAQYAADALGVHKSSINAVCIGNRVHTEGLNFRYLN